MKYVLLTNRHIFQRKHYTLHAVEKRLLSYKKIIATIQLSETSIVFCDRMCVAVLALSNQTKLNTI